MKKPRALLGALSLSKRLTLLVMAAMGLACVILAAAMTVAGDQMVYTIYAAQTTVTRGSEDYALPTVSKDAPRREDVAAKFQYRVESIIYVICTVAAAGVAAYMITESCLHPLVALKNEVTALSAENLAALPQSGAAPTGDEIESLSNAFEGMRRRLDGAFETQKRFSASAAHELRTPLAVIQTKLDVFSKREDHTEEEYRALIGTVGRQTERLSLLVKDLLDMSCLEEVPMDDCIDLAPLLEEVARELEPLAAPRGITFRVMGEGMALGSDRLVVRAVYNLAENAVKYGAEGGIVDLSAQTEGERVVIRVADDGPGIPPEHRDQIFEPFYRVDKSRSRSMGGAGLGLAITRAIAERHGGGIALEPTSVGTAFRLTLPQAGERPV